MKELKIGKYQHYKGGMAEVIGIAYNSETMEEYVAYYHQGTESDKVELWVRPIKMFQESIVINGKKVPRFKFISTKI